MFACGTLAFSDIFIAVEWTEADTMNDTVFLCFMLHGGEREIEREREREREGGGGGGGGGGREGERGGRESVWL